MIAGEDSVRVWASAHGVVLPASLVRTGEGVLATVFGDDGEETHVLARQEDLAEAIEAAAKNGAPIILQGHLSKPDANSLTHLEVRIEGPVELIGVVSNIEEHLIGDRPELRFWMNRELRSEDGTTHYFGTGVNIFGVAAKTASSLQVGDRIRLSARYGSEGFIATSPVSILPISEPEMPDEPAM